MLSLRLPKTIFARKSIFLNVRYLSQSIGQYSIRQVHPFSNIKIKSNYHLKVKPYDLLECPDGNILRIALKPKDSNEPISVKLTDFVANFNADVQVDDQDIAIDAINNSESRVNTDELMGAVECVVEIPVKANLKISSNQDVSIQNMYSDEICVFSDDGDITTKDVHTTNLSLTAQNGNIRCEGSTLAQKLDVRSYGEKNIHLNKILGGSLTAITENGNISTNSCYSEGSKFITQKGGLHLKNVHKSSEMYLLDGGDVDVTGFHGVLNATTNGGTLNFQLTEIYGESCIEAKNPEKFNINLSEFVEQHTCLSVSAKEILLDTTLDHLQKIKQDGSEDELRTGNRDLNEDSLSINTNGRLELGKLSWMDTIKLKLAADKM